LESHRNTIVNLLLEQMETPKMIFVVFIFYFNITIKVYPTVMTYVSKPQK